MDSMGHPKTWRAKLLLLIGGTVVGLLLAELGLRLAGVGYPLPYAPDPFCGTRLQPGLRGWWTKEGRAWIEINPQGFRQGARGPAKPPGTFRVAVLGDSFIEAFQVPEEATFCAVLERELSRCRALSGRRVEVLNFGASGYGTAQELLMLENYVWDYAPDAVVLAFFAANDVRNNAYELEPDHARPFLRREDGCWRWDDSFRQHPDYVKARSPSVRRKVALINRLRLLQLANEVHSRWRQRTAATTAGDADQAGVDQRALAPPSDAAWSAAWETTEELLRQCHRVTSARGVPFFLVSIGHDVQVDPDPARRAAWCQRLQVADLSYADQRLQAIGAREGFPVITLAEPMRRAAEQQHTPLHGFANTPLGQGHWNAAGHRRAAELVSDAMCPSLRPEEKPAPVKTRTSEPTRE